MKNDAKIFHIDFAIITNKRGKINEKEEKEK